MKKAIIIISIIMATGIGTVFTLSHFGVFGNDEGEGTSVLNGPSVTRNSIGANGDVKKVKLTESVSDIEDGSFSNLSSLKTINVDKDNNYYASDNGILYNKDFTELICVPQNVSSLKNIKSSCIRYSQHALDGVSSEEKAIVTQAIAKNLAKLRDKDNKEKEKILIAQTINENNSKTGKVDNNNKNKNSTPQIVETPSIDTNSNKSSSFTPRYKVNEDGSNSASANSTPKSVSNNSFTPRTKSNGGSSSSSGSTSGAKSGTSQNNNSASAGSNISNSNNNTNAVNNVSSAEFEKYVYIQDGRKYFKYTGTGHSTIVVPEGVEVLAGFTDDQWSFNDEITAVVLPSTIQKSCASNMFNRGGSEGNDDYSFYNVLYQCRNLKSVTGGNFSYKCYGNYVARPGYPNDIIVWSATERHKYDVNAYINYNSGQGR